MTDTKKSKISNLMKKLSDLPAEKREELSLTLGITNPEGHQLTPRNQCLIYFQNVEEVSISVVAGYKQWQKFQRQVKKGSHGFLIAVPSGNKGKEDDEDGEIFFLYKTVFDISQTEELPDFN
jgi:N-terminal domain of anti-restriction factor ArdC